MLNTPASGSRRSFLQCVASLPVAAALPPLRAAAPPPTPSPAAALKPALNAYSFLELLNANAQDSAQGVDLFGVCDFAAKEGFAAVDLTGYFMPGYPSKPDNAYLFRLKRHAHKLGLDISGTGVRNDFTTADKSVRAAAVTLIKEWIEVAARLGAPSLRLFGDSQPPFKTWQAASGNATREAVEAWMVQDYRECADHAAKFGVILAVQNHGDFLRTGAEHLSLLKRVDHEWCAALVDTGKYLTDDPYADMAVVVPLAVNWQIKETLHSKPDAPRTDFTKLVKIIREGGYRGYLPIETLSMRRKNYDAFVEVAKVHAELRSALAAE